MKKETFIAPQITEKFYNEICGIIRTYKRQSPEMCVIYDFYFTNTFYKGI